MKLLYSYMGHLCVYKINFTSLYLSFIPTIIGHKLVYVRQVFFVLPFCFIMFSYALAQSPEKSGTVSGKPENLSPNFPGKDQDGEISLSISYKYIFRKQAYDDNKKAFPNIAIDHYPLVAYDLDYSSTPNIKIGDNLPSFLKSIAFQYVDGSGGTKTGTIEELSKGKLLIFDFWATWCAPCIQSMEKWNTIANTLGKNIQVLGFMLDHNFRAQYFGVEKGWSLPIVFGPEVYIINSMFFDRQVVSRSAWIMDGKLVAITDTKGYDLRSVMDIIEGKKVDIPSNKEWTYSQ